VVEGGGGAGAYAGADETVFEFGLLRDLFYFAADGVDPFPDGGLLLVQGDEFVFQFFDLVLVLLLKLLDAVDAGEVVFQGLGVPGLVELFAVLSDLFLFGGGLQYAALD
jgi:hypothetical protein